MTFGSNARTMEQTDGVNYVNGSITQISISDTQERSSQLYEHFLTLAKQVTKEANPYPDERVMHRPDVKYFRRTG
jgi:hypothetical protein